MAINFITFEYSIKMTSLLKTCVYCSRETTPSNIMSPEFKRQEFFETLFDEKNELNLFCDDVLVLKRHVCSSVDPFILFLEKIKELQSVKAHLDGNIVRKEASRLDSRAAAEFVKDFKFYKKHKAACLDPSIYKRNPDFAKDLDPTDKKFPLLMIAVVHASALMKPREATNFLAVYRKVMSPYFDDHEKKNGSVHCLQASYYRVMLQNMLQCDNIREKPNLLTDMAEKMIEEHPSSANWAVYIEAYVVSIKERKEGVLSPAKRKRASPDSKRERLSLLLRTWSRALERLDSEYDEQPRKRARHGETDAYKKADESLDRLITSTKRLMERETDRSSDLLRSLNMLSTEIAELSSNPVLVKTLNRLSSNLNPIFS